LETIIIFAILFSGTDMSQNMKFCDQIQAISQFNKKAVLVAFANPDDMQ